MSHEAASLVMERAVLGGVGGQPAGHFGW